MADHLLRSDRQARWITERQLRHAQTCDKCAANRGWEREVERHRRTVRRIQELLTELDAPLEGSAQPASTVVAKSP